MESPTSDDIDADHAQDPQKALQLLQLEELRAEAAELRSQLKLKEAAIAKLEKEAGITALSKIAPTLKAAGASINAASKKTSAFITDQSQKVKTSETFMSLQEKLRHASASIKNAVSGNKTAGAAAGADEPAGHANTMPGSPAHDNEAA